MPSPQPTVIYVGELYVSARRAEIKVLPVGVKKETAKLIKFNKVDDIRYRSQVDVKAVNKMSIQEIINNNAFVIATAYGRDKAGLKSKLIEIGQSSAKELQDQSNRISNFLSSQSPT